MLLKGDKVLHTRHPEWGVGIVQKEKSPGYMVLFQDDIYMKRKREWICSKGHLHKVNEYSAEEVRTKQAEFEEEIRLRKILEARRMLEGTQDGMAD